jgi:DNA-binding CsgD family transcriptional regulator
VTHSVLSAALTAGPPTDDGLLALLTEREREVLSAVAEGMSNDEIAGALHMSPATARTHVGRVLTELDARDRAPLVAMAWRAGLVPRRRVQSWARPCREAPRTDEIGAAVRSDRTRREHTAEGQAP